MNPETSSITPYQAGLGARKTPPPVPPPVMDSPPQRQESQFQYKNADAAVQADPGQPKSHAHLYPTILRWVGAGTLGAAALCFLLSGWVDGTPLLRTGSFLGFTAFLSIAGVFCAYRWGEDKGARTFLALATAFLPANFAQLGALIHAESSQDSLGHVDGIRGIFTFAPVGEVHLLLAGLVSLAILVPVAFTGFSALARAGARKMTGLFLAGNAVLLLPWREANLIALIAAGLFAALIWVDRRHFSRETALKTWEGIAMRTLLFAPLGLLLARNLVMHPLTPGMLSVIAGLAAWVCFAGLPRCMPWERARVASQFAGYGCLLLAWLCILLEVFSQLTLWLEATLPLIFLPWCLAVFGLSFIGAGKGIAARGLASLVALAACWLNLGHYGSLGYLPGLLAILTAVALLLAAFLLEEKTVLVAGGGLLVVAIGYQMHFALTLVQQNLWLSLALAGAGVILASSYLERHGRGLRQRALRMRRHWQAWQ